MRTDIPVPTEQAYHEEFDTESEPIGGDAPSSADFADGGSFELDVQGEDAPHPRRRGPDQDPDATLHRHITHCTICNHPEREAIEECILHWHSPTVIADEFDLGDRRVVWRHARAFGLSQLRAEQTRHALGYLIEQAQSVFPSADAIIRAVRALACLDENGRWHEPRKEVVITHRYEDATSAPREEDRGDLPGRAEGTGTTAASRGLPAVAGGRARDGRRNRRRRESTRPLGGQNLPADRHGFSSAKRPMRPLGWLGRLLSPLATSHSSLSFPGTRAEKSSA